MTSTRKIRVIGRFASPQRSREGTPQLSGDDSSDSEDCSVERTAVHAQIDSDMDDNDANDADDEGDNRKESRGRNRKPRRISLSRAILN